MEHLFKDVADNTKTYSETTQETKLLYEQVIRIISDRKTGQLGTSQVKEIFDRKILPNNMRSESYGETLLSEAVRHSLAMVKVLVEAGEDPNTGNMMDGETPLEWLLEQAEYGEGLDSEQLSIVEYLKGVMFGDEDDDDDTDDEDEDFTGTSDY